MKELKSHKVVAIYKKYPIFNTAKITVISPDFLVWKFCGKTQFQHSFRRISRIVRNYAETVHFHKISTPGNQVKLLSSSQCSTSNSVFDSDIFTEERIQTSLELGKWQMHEPLIFNLKGLCELFLFGIKSEMHLINVLENSRRFYYAYYFCLFQASSLFITFETSFDVSHGISCFIFHFCDNGKLKKLIIAN